MSFTIRYEILPSTIYTIIRREVERRGELNIQLQQDPDTGLWGVSGTDIAALDELNPTADPHTLLWVIGLILKGDPQLCPPEEPRQLPLMDEKSS